MRNFLKTFALATGLTAAMVAFALDLSTAKARGLVGEQPSGYIAAVGVATPEIAALVKDINSRRHAAYADIAARNGTDIAAVEKLAGKKAIEKTPPGEYVRLPSGQWTKVQ